MDSELDILIYSSIKLFPQKIYQKFHALTGSATFSKKCGGILAKTEQYSLLIKNGDSIYILC